MQIAGEAGYPKEQPIAVQPALYSEFSEVTLHLEYAKHSKHQHLNSILLILDLIMTFDGPCNHTCLLFAILVATATFGFWLRRYSQANQYNLHGSKERSNIRTKMAARTSSNLELSNDNVSYTPSVLVIIIGDHLGGLETHARFINLFLRPQCADLATFKNELDDPDDILHVHSKYIWNMTEYDCENNGIVWGEYYSLRACSNCSRWRTNLGSTTRNPRFRQPWMSGLIHLAYRHESLRRIRELGLTKLYDFFTFTRSDAYFSCMPPFREMYRDPRSVALPDISSSDGYTDRLIVCPKGLLKHCASPIYRSILDSTYVGPGNTSWGFKASPDFFWRHRLSEEGLQVRFFAGTFIMARDPVETSRCVDEKFDESLDFHGQYRGIAHSRNVTPADFLRKTCEISEVEGSSFCSNIADRDLKKSFAAFAAISMNNDGTLNRAIRQIEAFGDIFADYVVVIVENDSKDETRPILFKWMEHNSRVTVNSANFGLKKRSSISWLAHLRNRALEILYARVYGGTSQQPWRVDLIVVLDLDLVAIDLSGFTSAANAVLGKSLSRPMVGATANGVHRDGRYYDIYAFRSCHWHWNASRGVMFKSIPLSLWDSLMPLYPSDLPPFPVRSAFSGIAIYNARDVFGPLPVDTFPLWRGSESAIAAGESKDSEIGTVFENLEKIGKDDKLPCVYGNGGVEECEHIAFHSCLNARAASRGKAPLHLFPEFGAQYSFGRSTLLKKHPTSYVLPGDSPDFNELSVRQPKARIAQPYFWKGPLDMKCPDATEKFR